MSDYSASANANNFHMTPRGGRPNDFVGAESSEYVIGLVISGVVFIVLGVLYAFCTPMYMCCCRKSKTKEFKAIRKRIYFFAIMIGVGIIGCCMGFAGGASARDGIVKVADTFTDISDLLGQVADAVSGNQNVSPPVPGVSGALKDLGEEFDNMEKIGCAAYLSSGLTGSTVEPIVDAADTFRDLSDSLTGQLLDFSDYLVQVSELQYTGTMVIFGLILSMFCLFLAFMLCVHKMRVQKPARCLSWLTQPICYLLCILCWILTATLMMMGSATGDMCQDPDRLISDQVGDPVLVYYQSCTGGKRDPPNPLVVDSLDLVREQVVNLKQTMVDLKQGIDLVCNKATQNSFASAIDVNDDILDALDSVETTISCRPLQNLYRNVVWGVLCGDVMDMFAFLFASCFCIALSLFFLVPLYKQVMRNTQKEGDEDDKVVPMVEAFDEEGNQVFADTGADVYYDADGNEFKENPFLTTEGVEMTTLPGGVAAGGLAEAQLHELEHQQEQLEQQQEELEQQQTKGQPGKGGDSSSESSSEDAEY
jgi:hypothetical protein